MLNGRLYRAAFVPVVIALAVAAFSLGAAPAPAQLHARAGRLRGRRARSPNCGGSPPRIPQRRPGGAGDERLARTIAATLEGLGGTAGGGFSVRVRAARRADDRRRAPAHDGHRPAPGLDRRGADRDRRPPRRGDAPGSRGRAVGHRRAARARARVRGARDQAHDRARLDQRRQRRRRGGRAAVGRSSPGLRRAVDAAIVLGDLAGATRAPAARRAATPTASARRRCSCSARSPTRSRHEAGVGPGRAERARPARAPRVPLAAGEQGVLDAAGLPAVLVQVSGERGPAARASR